MAKQDVKVELFYGGQWNDVTSDVYARDEIKITQGRSDAYSEAKPSTCQLTFDNRDDKYHPRNPNSALFGLIGRNTPIRVSVGGDVRFAGEVAEWMPRRALKGDVWTELTANGLSRRLGQGVSPLRSAPRRYIPSTSVDAYWPLDEGLLADAASPVVGGDPMRGTGIGSFDSRFGSAELAPWLGTGLRLVGAVLAGNVSGMADTGEFVVDHVRSGETGDSDGGRLFVEGDHTAEDGDPQIRWQVNFEPADGTVQVLVSYIEETSSSITAVSSAVSVDFYDGRPHHVRFHVEQNAAKADVTLYVDGEQVISETTVADTDVQPVGRIRLTELSSGSGGVTLGHVAAWSDPPGVADAVAAAFGFAGETAGERVERLCGEEGVTVSVSGTASETEATGPQFPDTLLDVLREAAVADLGILADAVSELGLSYRTQGSLYSQDAALTLDWDSGQLSPPLEPVLDDHDTRNDVTVSRRGGSEARAELTAGALSTQDPPDGVGRYDTDVDVNVAGDGFLSDQAGWRLHLGTVDEDRFPRVTLDLDANSDLADEVAAVEPGDRIDLTGLPDHISVDDVRLVVHGWSETIGSHRRLITFNCGPYSPFDVGTWEDAPGDGSKWDTAGSQLDAGIDATETSVEVAVTVGPAWTTDANELPLDIGVGGERMTVSAISAETSGVQTFTVTRSVNGVTKSHSAGAQVGLWPTHRLVWALGGY